MIIVAGTATATATASHNHKQNENNLSNNNDDYLHCYYEFEVYQKSGFLKPKQMLGWVCNLNLDKGTFDITQDPMQSEKYWHDWDCDHEMYYDDYISDKLKEIGKATGYIFKCKIDQWYDKNKAYGKRITDAEIQDMKNAANNAQIAVQTITDYIKANIREENDSINEIDLD